MSANPRRCPECRKGLLQDRHWPWKTRLSRFLKYTIVLWPWGWLLTMNPDFWECPDCGRKKPVSNPMAGSR